METINNRPLCITGLIGDFDGDGRLDYVFITSIVYTKVDMEWCMQGMQSSLHLQKVNLELGLQNGDFPRKNLSPKTTMQSGQIQENSAGIKFLPLEKQKWTQYMGKDGHSKYIVG